MSSDLRIILSVKNKMSKLYVFLTKYAIPDNNRKINNFISLFMHLLGDLNIVFEISKDLLN